MRHKVFLSVSQLPVFLPIKLAGKSIFYWFDRLGILRASAQSFIGRKIQTRPDPIIGLELKPLIKSSRVQLMPRAIDAAQSSIHFLDGSVKEFANIIWCTGFELDYNWLNIPEALYNENGSIIHKRGITTVNGLYIVGMPWQSRRTSALIGGVDEDAKYIVNSIIENGPASMK